MNYGRNITSFAAAFLAVALFGTWGTAQAQTVGSVNVNVTMPEHIILHVPTNLDITFTAPAGSAVETEADPAIASQALAATATFAAGVTATVGTDYTAASPVAVTITGAFAVRGMTSTGNIVTTIAATTASGTLTVGAVTSTVSVANPAADMGGGSNSVAAPGMAKASAAVGDITFDLDISAAKLAGQHTGIVLELTCSNA